MISVDESFRSAVDCFRSGKLAEAQRICLQIQQQAPDHARSWELSAAIANRTQNSELELRCLRRAVELDPTEPRYHQRLGAALHVSGRSREAEHSLRKALQLRPDLAAVHYELGNVLKDQARLSQSASSYRQAVRYQPDFVEAHFNLGRTLQRIGQLDEAIGCFLRAAQLRPEQAEIHYCLAGALETQGLTRKALVCYGRAIQLEPGLEKAHARRALMLIQQGQLNYAIETLQQAREQFPAAAWVSNHLGIALKRKGLIDEAIDCFQQALNCDPGFAEARGNLGNAYSDQGMLDEAIDAYRQAIDSTPDWRAHSNLLYTLSFHDGYSPQQIDQEHRHWNRLYAAPLARFVRPHRNDRCKERKLRVGYVSPDFNTHPVGRFMLPILEHHDHQAFTVYCYSSVHRPDETTEQCRQHADCWRHVLDRGDHQLAELVREDGIDILVDLTMHMANHRLLMFARKPAPVQVTYLAYCGTTGLDTIDYRLTDPWLDPPNASSDYYSEQSVHLPHSYWCYEPVGTAVGTQTRPSRRSQSITFGSLNNFCKVTAPTLRTWSQLLNRVPHASLLLHARHGSHRTRVREFLREEGIRSDRVRFVPNLPLAEYLQTYHQIDIALDPFPYGGGTTSCDALWMGVPLVSLAGRTAVGRGGLSILSNIGLSSLVATDTGQYIDIAAGLAADIQRLNKLRTTLRDRMLDSPLMDADGFTRGLENAYRSMWSRWCDQR